MMDFNSEKDMQEYIIKSALQAISNMHIVEYLCPSQESRAKFIKEQIFHIIGGLNITYQLNIDKLDLELLEES
jgi:hypothetical protein